MNDMLKVIWFITNKIPDKKLSWEAKMFLMTHYFSSPFYKQINFKNWFSNINNNQYGGGKKRVHKYKGHEFTINIDTDEENKSLVITMVSYDDEAVNCFMLVKTRNTDYIVIQNLEYNRECAKKGLPKKGGEIILMFLLKYITVNKEKLGINRIVLSDNSFIFCDNCEGSIKLAHMYTLTKGDTWYGKFGFRPYNASSNEPNIKKIEKYEENKEKMNKLKVRDIDLIKIMKENENDKNKEVFERNMLLVKALQKKHKDVELRKILKSLSKHNCCFMVHMQEILMEELGLTSFYQTSFYLDI